MAIKNMKAIEYNLFMTMIKLLMDRVPEIAKEYNIKGKEIPILPTYPSDLTAIQKPSIIMMKFVTNSGIFIPAGKTEKPGSWSPEVIPPIVWKKYSPAS